MLIVLYIIGYILSYVWFRDLARAIHNGKWLQMEKIIVIALSLFSWVGVFVNVILFILVSTTKIDLDKECKW